MRCAATSSRATASSTEREVVALERGTALGELGREELALVGRQHRAELGHRLVGRVEQALAPCCAPRRCRRRTASASCICSDSATSRSMSSSVRPVVGWTRHALDAAGAVIARGHASTPSASMSNATSIFGTPRGAGGMPVSSKCASDLLSPAISRSPWSTWTLTNGWLSIVVEKISVARAGSAVLRGMRRVNTPPIVSTPSDSGVTSSSSTSWTSPVSTPPWMAAPTATTSSGLTRRLASLPNISATTAWTRGMRVWPPTRITTSMSFARHARHRRARAGTARASPGRAARRAPRARSRSQRLIRWRGWPSAPAARNGRLISVDDRARQLDLRALGRVLEPLQRHPIAAQVHAVVLRRRTSRACARRSRCRSPRRRGTCRRRSSARGTRRRRARGSRYRTCRRRGRRPRRAPRPAVSTPYASAAAVGSLTMRRTLRPAIRPASLVAWRWASSKYAGTVITASVTSSPSQSSAVCRIFCSTIARDLRRRVVAAAHADVRVAVRRGDDLVRARQQVALDLRVLELAAHQPLDRVDRVLGVRHRLAARRLADEPLARLREADDRRRRARALGVRDHDGLRRRP